MEAFFQFKGNDTAADDIYLNFEMNAMVHFLHAMERIR